MDAIRMHLHAHNQYVGTLGLDPTHPNRLAAIDKLAKAYEKRPDDVKKSRAR